MFRGWVDSAQNLSHWSAYEHKHTGMCTHTPTQMGGGWGEDRGEKRGGQGGDTSKYLLKRENKFSFKLLFKINS